MSVIKYDPFRELERFFDENFSFGNLVSRRDPPLNLYEQDNCIVCELHVPDLDKDNVNVTIDEGVLKVEGESHSDSTDRNKNYYRREARYGKFVRSVLLPSDIKIDGTKAEYHDGVLRVTLPKIKVSDPKKVEVKVK